MPRNLVFKLPTACLVLATIALVSSDRAAWAETPPSSANVVAGVQPKIVKIYGAGGFKGMEFYQSGFLFSAEGHILTVWSYVLDTDYITVTLDDGRKFQAKLLGVDPRVEIAVLKIEAENLPHFDLKKAAEAEMGTRVLAFNNLYGVATGNEPASVLRGVVSTRTSLSARRGAFETPYRGDVYVLDAITNNPGAAGGAVTNYRGELIGMIGKELRNSLDNTWLNYALPIGEMIGSIPKLKAGETMPRVSENEQERPDAENPLQIASLGIVLVPDVLQRTPPFIDRVNRNSPAALAQLRPDDLIIFVNDRLVQSCRLLADELGKIERDAQVKLTIMRDYELIDVVLTAPQVNR